GRKGLEMVGALSLFASARPRAEHYSYPGSIPASSAVAVSILRCARGGQVQKNFLDNRMGQG
ncbi:MAG: hypothetical protein ACE5I9_04085, partial [Candidatus Methylomirabilales bacterium]